MPQTCVHPINVLWLFSHVLQVCKMRDSMRANITTIIVWTIRTILAFAFANDWNIRAWKTPLKNDKYHTFEITIYYEVNKPKIWKRKQRKIKNRGKKTKTKTQECLNNIRIRFSTYENECYARRTQILRTMHDTIIIHTYIHICYAYAIDRERERKKERKIY